MVGVPGDRVAPFAWRDGERVIAFGRGRAAEAVELAGGPGFALLTTERALAAAPALGDAAAVVHHVGQGTVPPLAAAALDALAPSAKYRPSPGSPTTSTRRRDRRGRATAP